MEHSNNLTLACSPSSSSSSIKYILSCDGGGVRGVATAQFLVRLEEALMSTQNKRIYDVFHMFAGASTGAIIILGLGVLKYSAASVLDLYSYENLQKIFTPQSSSLLSYFYFPNVFSPKYDGIGKADLLKQHFGDKRFNDTEKEIIIPTYDVEARKAVVWKNKHPSGATTANVLIRELADATSAAPTYFPTVFIDEGVDSENKPKGKWCIDGGVIANNPVMCAYAEIKRHYPNDRICVLSVGTGKRVVPISGAASRDFGSLAWMRNDLIGIMMDESVVEYQIEHILNMDDGCVDFVRVNSGLTIDEEQILAEEELDVVSEKNVEQLKNLGNYWWDKYGMEVLKMLDENTHNGGILQTEF